VTPPSNSIYRFCHHWESAFCWQ